MSERDHGNFGGGRNSGYSVEEITPGLPVQAPIPVVLEERIEVSRYLARALTALHSDMLDSNRPSVLLEVFFSRESVAYWAASKLNFGCTTPWACWAAAWVILQI